MVSIRTPGLAVVADIDKNRYYSTSILYSVPNLAHAVYAYHIANIESLVAWSENFVYNDKRNFSSFGVEAVIETC